MTIKSKPKPQAKITQAELKPQAKTTQADPKPTPAIIVFGLDQDDKPRAATFTADQVEHATKAAELMKLRVLKVEGPALTELAAHLEAGRRQGRKEKMSLNWCPMGAIRIIAVVLMTLLPGLELPTSCHCP